jgi:hypothetical protein
MFFDFGGAGWDPGPSGLGGPVMLVVAAHGVAEGDLGAASPSRFIAPPTR